MIGPPPIGPGTHVTLAYTLYDEEGDVVEEVDEAEPVTYVHGYGQLLPGIERAVEGMSEGQTREVTLEASGAFGEHDPEGILEIDRAEFEGNVAIGDEFVAETRDGDELPMRVVDVRDDAVVVDTNHPLAGQTLRCEVRVKAVRPATDDEIADAEDLLEARAHGDGCDHADGDPVYGTGLLQLGRKKPAPPS